MSQDAPNPGTQEAISAGCICPVMDNCRGRGYHNQPGVFVYCHGCPVHPNGVSDAEYEAAGKLLDEIFGKERTP